MPNPTTNITVDLNNPYLTVKNEVGTTHTQFAADFGTNATVAGNARQALVDAGLLKGNVHLFGFGTLNPWTDPNPSSFNINSVSGGGGSSVVLTLSGTHGYAVNDTVIVAGHSVSGLNKMWTVSAQTSTTITLMNSSAITPGTGGTVIRRYILSTQDGRINFVRNTNAGSFSWTGGAGIPGGTAILTACGAPDWMTWRGKNLAGTVQTTSTFGDPIPPPLYNTATYRSGSANTMAQEYANIIADMVVRYGSTGDWSGSEIFAVQVWNEMKSLFVDSDGYMSSQGLASDAVGQSGSNLTAVFGPLTLSTSAITNGSNTIHAVAHGLSTGFTVKFASTGVTAYDTHEFTITKIDNDNFSVKDATGAVVNAGSSSSTGTVTVPNFPASPNLTNIKADHTAASVTYKGQWDYYAYQEMYNAIWDAVKAVKPNCKIGGSYIPLDQSNATLQLSVSAVTIGGSTVTFTTSATHGMIGGDQVVINGIVGTGAFPAAVNDQMFRISFVSTTQFSIPLTTTGTYTSGGTVDVCPYSGRDLIALDYFLTQCKNTSRGPDYITLDNSIIHSNASNQTNDDTTRGNVIATSTKFLNAVRQIRARANYGGQPIGWSEFYLDSSLSTRGRFNFANHDYQRAAMGSIIFNMILGAGLDKYGPAVSPGGYALQWQPQSILPESTLSVSGCTNVSTTVTVTTTATNQLLPGDKVVIASVGGITNVNGNQTVATVPTGTTFTFTAGSTPSGSYTSGGTVQPWRSYQGNELSVYYDIQSSNSTFAGNVGVTQGSSTPFKQLLQDLYTNFPPRTLCYKTSVSGTNTNSDILASRSQCLVINKNNFAIDVTVNNAGPTTVNAYNHAIIAVPQPVTAGERGTFGQLAINS